MIHPHTQLKWMNDQIGYGVIATAPIPAGTVVYVQDEMEIVLDPLHPLRSNPAYAPLIDKYAFMDEAGNRILSWDIAKYVNHCCQANTLSTAYGFEIAVRDIQPGEEITDDYALFTSGLSFPLSCTRQPCRLQLTADDLAQNSDQWDMQIKQAMQLFTAVPQPLHSYIPAPINIEVTRYLQGEATYRSVRSLQVH